MTSTPEESYEDYNFGAAMGAEEAAKNNSVEFQRRLMFLSLKADPASVKQGKDKALVRFLTDFQAFPGAAMDKFNIPWISALQHYGPTRPKPEWVDEKANWPAKFGGGCRKDKIFSAKFNDVCPVHDQLGRPSSRTFALAVEREQVFAEDGKTIIGIRDKTREVMKIGPDGKGIKVNPNDPDSKEYEMETVKAYIVMSMGWKNFFAPLNGQASYFGSLLESDYLITRTGTDNNDTNYAPVRIGTINLAEGNEYGLPAGPFDLRDPAVKAKAYPDMPDLRRVIAERVSDDYLGRWFIPGYTPADKQGAATAAPAAGAPTAGAPATPDAPAAAAEPTPDALAALQARMAPQG